MRARVGGYFFDAIIRAEHVTTVKPTEHPVQSGAGVPDHSFNMPDQLTLEIGMSDVMDSIISGQFDTGETKSIGAYQKLKELQKKRQTVKVVSRLNTYENMLIEVVQAPDDVKTLYGLRCIVRFREIMVATVNESKVSDNEQVSEETNKGTIQSMDTTAAQDTKMSMLRTGA